MEQRASFDSVAWRRRLRVALGTEPADLVLTGGTIVDVFTEECYQSDIAIADGTIAGNGDYPAARQRLGLAGRFVAPSLIDGHVHLESSLV